MELPLQGGCQCGGIRYEIRTAPTAYYCCHCLDCQKQSGSAYGLSLIVEEDGFQITKGHTKFFTITTDKGNLKDCHFCPDCGVRMYHQSRHRPARLSLKGGTLDDNKSLTPKGHIWVSSGHSWAYSPGDIPCFEKGQQSDGELALDKGQFEQA